MMKHVVTGASGHVGYNVVQALQAEGSDVVATVHRNAAPLDRLGVAQVKADLLDTASLQHAFRDASCVVHLAAKISIRGDPDGSVWRVNVEGTRNVAQAALATGARMIHVSSVHAFDMPRAKGPMNETQPLARRSGNYAYDRSKAAAEDEVQRAVREGLEAVILNPAAVLGPADPEPSRMGQLLLDLRDRRLPALVGGAFDFVDVRDVTRSILAARSRGAIGENHLLGGHFASMRHIAQLAAAATGVPAPRVTVPLWVAGAALPFARWFGAGQASFTREAIGTLRHGVPIDSSKAQRLLGHQARPLGQTIGDTYAWFEAERR